MTTNTPPKRLRIPIRFKMLLVITTVLLVAIGSYLYLATSLFRADKLTYIYDLNASLVGTLSEQTRASLSVLVKEATLYARDAVEAEKIRIEEDLKSELFAREPDILRLEILTGVGAGDAFTGRRVALNAPVLEAMTLSEEDLDFARREHPLPLSALAGAGDHVYVHNSSLEPDSAILTVAFSYGPGAVVTVDFRHQRLLRIFGRSALHETFLVDERGQVLAHPNARAVIQAENRSSHALVALALTAKVTQGVKEFQDPQTGVAYLGGYSRVGLGRLWVLTQIPKDRALRASRELVERSVLFAIVIVLLSFLVSIFFSRYLAAPIRQLRAATEVLGKGKFDVAIEVRSRDEIGELAMAFNQMADALKQTQAQLIQSGRLAAFGQLGAGITHEVKNPMTGIVGFAQLAQSKVEDPEKTLELLELIEQEGLRCRDILVSFLKFAHAGEGRRDPISINQLLEDAGRIMRHQLNMHRVKLLLEPAPGDPLVKANALELQQVLMNIGINAQQAMPKGGTVRFSVTVEQSQGREEVVIRVKDNGPGIAEKIRDKIFEPFVTTKPTGTGTGLGLSVSFGIVESHGGTLQVESEPGEGSTFIIRLPHHTATRDEIAANA